jgi:molybdopterin/thiamine biosynthesis adenylyltransferase
MRDNLIENRYARQIHFASIGENGQRLISSCNVAILGCGALGTVVAEILARAGVGGLRLIDRDVVEWSNLQRQSLFDEQDAKEGNAKALAAAERLGQINSGVRVQPQVVDVTADNIGSTLGGADLVVDASDNFFVRFLLNDWSLKTRTPWVHGGCVGATGQVRLFTGEGSPCLRCFLPDPPPADTVATCDTAGVVGSATHMIASLQATEVIKWISGNRDAARTEMLSIDLWNNRIREIDVDSRLGRQCPACAQGRLEFLDGSRGRTDRASILCGRRAVQISGQTQDVVDLPRVAEKWHGIGRVQTNPFFVRLHLDDQTLTLFRDGRAVVGGTTEIREARIVYDRYVGS